MLIIRDAQIKALEQIAVDNYVIELATHCRAFSPHLCKTLRDEQLRVALRQGVLSAEAYGFTQRGPVRFYIDMMILLGSGFDSDPQYPWAAEILARKDYLSQMDRAEALHARTRAYLAQVDGVNNVHTLKALGELAALCRRGVTLRRESFEQDILRLMTEIHPRKVAQTGEEALRRLIADGMTKGQEGYGFRATRSLGLMVVLMFAFGHHFDCDPLLPWIARTMNQSDKVSPDTTAEELERRALIWLDAVLRNAEKNS